LAAARGWLQFVPPVHDVLTRMMQEEYPWLHYVEVVDTATFSEVAYRAAVLVRELVRRRVRHADPVAIGFAGGFSMRTVAEKLSQTLSQATDLPLKHVT